MSLFSQKRQHNAPLGSKDRPLGVAPAKAPLKTFTPFVGGDLNELLEMDDLGGTELFDPSCGCVTDVATVAGAMMEANLSVESTKFSDEVKTIVSRYIDLSKKHSPK